MSTAWLYILSWVSAVVATAVGIIIVVPFCVALCIGAMFYSARGHRLGVRRSPRNPRGLWLERDAGVPADSS